MDDSFSKMINQLNDKIIDYKKSIYGNNYYALIKGINNSNFKNIYETIISNEYLSNYLNYYYIHSVNNKLNEYNNTNTMHYLNIISYINKEKLINTFENIDEKEQLLNIEISKELKPVEIAIQQYLGYAYRKKSKISVEEAYDKSIIKDINDQVDLMFQLEKIIREKSDCIFLDKDALIDLAVNVRNVAENENAFSCIVSYIYKAIYEGSNIGKENQIYKMAKDKNNKTMSDVMDLIKHIRQFYQHSRKKTDKKHVNEMKKFIKSVLGRDYAFKAKDWVQLQLNLYEKINEMLKNIINELDSI